MKITTSRLKNSVPISHTRNIIVNKVLQGKLLIEANSRKPISHHQCSMLAFYRLKLIVSQEENLSQD